MPFLKGHAGDANLVPPCQRQPWSKVMPETGAVAEFLRSPICATWLKEESLSLSRGGTLQPFGQVSCRSSPSHYVCNVLPVAPPAVEAMSPLTNQRIVVLGGIISSWRSLFSSCGRIGRLIGGSTDQRLAQRNPVVDSNVSNSTWPPVAMVHTDVSWTKDDLYMRLKDLKRQLEFSDIQEEYIKDDPRLHRFFLTGWFPCIMHWGDEWFQTGWSTICIHLQLSSHTSPYSAMNYIPTDSVDSGVHLPSPFFLIAPVLGVGTRRWRTWSARWFGHRKRSNGCSRCLWSLVNSRRWSTRVMALCPPRQARQRWGNGDPKMVPKIQWLLIRFFFQRWQRPLMALIVSRHHEFLIGFQSLTPCHRPGSNYFVRILSTLNRELLKPNCSVALHRHSHAVVDILPPEADSTVPWKLFGGGAGAICDILFSKQGAKLNLDCLGRPQMWTNRLNPNELRCKAWPCPKSRTWPMRILEAWTSRSRKSRRESGQPTAALRLNHVESSFSSMRQLSMGRLAM